MKILLLNHEFPPLGGGGGRVCYELARQFVQKDHHVSVITTFFGDLPRCENIEGIEVYRVYGCRKSALDNNVCITAASFLWWGNLLAKQLIQKQCFDLIHAYFTIPAGLLGDHLKRQTKLPLIVSPHGSDVPHHNPEKFNLPIRLLAPVIGQVWRRADRVVAVSDGLRQTALRTAPNIDIEVIHNGIDAHHFSPPDIPLQNKIPQMLSVGRLVKLKGLHHLLEALMLVQKKGRAFHLQIAGEGPEKARLERLSTQYGLSDSITFLGQVPYKNLPKYYQQSDLFVLPSLAESFGQVFAEAMACGLPVIGSTTGGIPEVVGPHQREWLITPGDVPSLAQKLLDLLRLPEQRQKLGKMNVDYVRNHFTWSHRAHAYLDLYKTLIPKPQMTTKANRA